MVDAYTQECLALEADTSLGRERVTRMLNPLMEERGRPGSAASDNGPEFRSLRMESGAEERQVALVNLQPNRPVQNEHMKNFHGRLHDDRLNVTWFRKLGDVRCTLAT